VNKRLLLDLGKYVLAVGLLTWVVHANWAPPPTKAVASLGASTVGLCATPGGPLLAAASAVPGRTEPRGLGYVWQRHVIDGQPLHFRFLVIGFTVYVLAVLITLVRWYLLVQALDLTLSFRDALRYGFVGIFFNTFLPGSVGGDIIKAAALARTQNRRTAAVATVIMDRLIALWALVWFVAILGGIFWLAGMLSGPSAVVASTIIALAIGIVVVTATLWLLVGLLPDHRAERFAGRLSHLPVVGTSAGEMWRAVWMYRRKQKSVAVVMALTWVAQVGFVVAFWCCACTLWSPELGPIPSLTQHFLLVPIGLTMQALVPTPGGAGGGEWGFAALYVLFRASEANGVLASLVQRMLSWILGLAGYGVYFWLRPAVPKRAVTEPTTLTVPAPTPSALAG
jgi:hypothetical protein